MKDETFELNHSAIIAISIIRKFRTGFVDTVLNDGLKSPPRTLDIVYDIYTQCTQSHR